MRAALALRDSSLAGFDGPDEPGGDDRFDGAAAGVGEGAVRVVQERPAVKADCCNLIADSLSRPAADGNRRDRPSLHP